VRGAAGALPHLPGHTAGGIGEAEQPSKHADGPARLPRGEVGPRPRQQRRPVLGSFHDARHCECRVACGRQRSERVGQASGVLARVGISGGRQITALGRAAEARDRHPLASRRAIAPLTSSIRPIHYLSSELIGCPTELVLSRDGQRVYSCYSDIIEPFQIGPGPCSTYTRISSHPGPLRAISASSWQPYLPLSASSWQPYLPLSASSWQPYLPLSASSWQPYLPLSASSEKRRPTSMRSCRSLRTPSDRCALQPDRRGRRT